MIEAEQLNIVSPKRDKSQQKGWEAFFPYYAGYPESFASSILDSLDVRSKLSLFDPWNGSGTTTYVGAEKGFNVFGQDINPAMVIVARARMLQITEADTLEPLAKEIIRGAKSLRKIMLNDPLLIWFMPATARIIRGIESSMRKHLVGALTKSANKINLDNISSLASTYYVALFAVCRQLTKMFRPTNPTWLKMPRTDEDRLEVSASDIEDMFMIEMRSMSKTLLEKASKQDGYQARVSIRLADSASSTIEKNSIDLVLTSPPYCTRIDYTSATRIELAILHRLLSIDVVDLSRKMIGSIRVPLGDISVDDKWGNECRNFMDKVRHHNSKASAGYYYKTHADYFSKIYKSIGAIESTLKPYGLAVMVIQDSYYKDVHNNLAKIISEMAFNQGLRLIRQEDFYSSKSMSGLNRHVKNSRKTVGATESVVCFSRMLAA